MTLSHLINKHVNVGMHARKVLLFSKGSTRVKQTDLVGSFAEGMGAFDSVGICALIGLHIFDTLKNWFPSGRFSLYRDDALTISRHTLDGNIKDLISSTITSKRVKIIMETMLIIASFLDRTLYPSFCS